MTEQSRVRRLPWWVEVPLTLVVALLLAVVVTTFVVQPFVIPSGSMSPTLVKGDRILVQKWSADIERGDVVVFRDPGQWLAPQREPGPFGRALRAVGLTEKDGHLIKRVIGVAGDEVRCCDARGRTLVNGAPVDEPYLADPAVNAATTFQVTVPRGRIWVEGDNRGNSEDSRLQQDTASEGFVPVELVVGRLWTRVWPLDRLGAPGRTAAFDGVPAASGG